MAFPISPQVQWNEIDLTTIIPSVSTAIAGFVGQFRWGPVDEVITLSDENELVSTFNKPDNTYFGSFFTAANFLAYSNNLKLVRVVGANALNAIANANANAVLIKNSTDYENNYANGTNGVGPWAARYAGALGNTLKVSICPSSNAFSKTLTGTINVEASNTTVTGTNTVFTTELVVGSYLVVNGETLQVSAIANNTSATLVTGPAANANAQTAVGKWEYYAHFDSAPGTSNYASAVAGANDELHVVVVDEDGGFTGTAGTIIEKYPFYSKASDAKSEDGTLIYYKDAIFRKSRYVYWMDHISGATNWGNTAANTTFTSIIIPNTVSLSLGADGTAATDGEKELGYDRFSNPETVDVSFLLTGHHSTGVQQYVIENIAEIRKDCVVFVSPQRADVVDNVGAEVTSIANSRNALTSTSYAFMDSNWKYQYDKYNDVYRWIALNGDMAGLAARTDNDRDAWWSFAGYNRGLIKNVIKLAWNPDKTDRDELYKIGVNPVITAPGFGALLFGDKTLLNKPSAFDRINVRRLFIVLEKAIATAAKFSLFEFNDEFTRAQFIALVEPFLRDVQGRRGLTDFRVVCDSTNNTGEVIDRNEFIGDIYLKPTRSINYITLNFVAVRTGVSFEEIVGKF